LANLAETKKNGIKDNKKGYFYFSQDRFGFYCIPDPSLQYKLFSINAE
jgi:hypothetical protein